MTTRQDQATELRSAAFTQIDAAMRLAVEAMQCGFPSVAESLKYAADRLEDAVQSLDTHR